jgi:hypothetical protein
MIDIHIKQSLYKIAENVIKELEFIFADLINIDMNNQLLHMHIFIVSTQISYYKLNHSKILKK